MCPVHEIDEVDGKTFLAMAFLKGETLEDRIAKGPLPIKDALDIARQVADGLDAAHEAGIVHRDIKPANVLVDAKGHATIMDFGLARLTEASRLTKVDTAMGTVAYMSPEQAQGMDVDHRSDIWSLGCVLYEMVAGQRPFQGQYDQALLYEIVHEEIAPLTSIRADVPMELEFIVGECLAKDRDDRTNSTQDLTRKLRTLAEKLKSGRSTILRTAQMTGAVPAKAGQTLNPVVAQPSSGSERKWRASAVVFAVAFLSLLAFNWKQSSTQTPDQPVRRFSFSQPGLTGAVISPDGRHVAFAAETNGESSVWLRAIGSEMARQVPGTEGARPELAWSPDSRSIVFAAAAQAKRVAIDGGEALTLCDLSVSDGNIFGGAAWSPDGERIVLSSRNELWEIPARGGEPRVLVETQSGAPGPHFLPIGGGPDAFVYRSGAARAAGRIMVLNLETGESSEIGPGGWAVYSQQGYFIHQPADPDEDGLSALPFSLASLQATGESFRIAEEGGGVSVAGDGTLIYLDGINGDNARTLVWRDRSGAALETVGQPQRDGRWPTLSPDGRRVAVGSSESGSPDIWIHDLTRSTKMRLTFDSGLERTPAWSPSGDQIVYWQQSGDRLSLMRRASDGTGQAVALVQAENGLPTPDWSRDGRYLIYGQNGSTDNSGDLLYVEIGADGTAGEPVTFLATPSNETAPKLSPDGRFVAYSSDESGRGEVYIRPFRSGDGRWQASVDGGGQPRWSRDGKELFYVRDTTLLSVSVATGEGVTLSQPRELFQSENLQVGITAPVYDVSADGQRFLTLSLTEQGAEAAMPTVRVVMNWAEEFRDRER